MSRSSALRGSSARRYGRGVLCCVATAASLAAMLVLTSPASAAAAPSIVGESVSGITETDATLEATINPNGQKTTYQFRLESGCLPPMACMAITTYPLPSGELSASSEPQPVSLDLNSAGLTLKPNTRYAFSVEATNTDGTVKGPEQQFTTPGPPVIESESASHITQTDATLEAQINPGGLETSYRFHLEWGCGLSPNEVCPLYCNTGPEAGSSSEPAWSWCEGRHVVSLPSGEITASFQAQNVSADLNEVGITLHPGTMYRYSVAATNSVGKAEGADQTFTTIAGEGPVIESESLSHLTPTDATLEAQINTEGLETTFEFHLLERWWCEELTPACYPPIRVFTLPSGKLLGSFVGQSVSLDLNSAGVTLTAGHDFYEYWVTASNAAGTTEGQHQSFTTPPEAGVEPLTEPTEPSGSTDTASSAASRSLQPGPVTPRRRDHLAGHSGRLSRRHRRATRSRTLVAYREEQSGIAFRYTSLLVSTRGQATVRFERCKSRIHLNASLWRRLKTALRRTDMHALAGDYVPATPHAEESTWVITVGHNRVRITGSVIPQQLRAKLEPLLKVLRQVVSVGKRRMPRSCGSKRTIKSTE